MRAILDLWRSVLDPDLAESFDDDSDLFDAGGTSIDALRVLAAIRSEFAADVPLAAFWSQPTPAALAAVIRSQGDAETKTWEPLVVLQPGDPRGAVFLTAPSGGRTPYFELTRFLSNDRAVFGLESKGLDGSRPWQSVREAGSALAATVEAEGRPPHILGGFSFGSLTATETARVLAGAEHPVAVVLLNPQPFDTFAVEFDQREVWNSYIARNLRAAGKAPGQSLPDEELTADGVAAYLDRLGALPDDLRFLSPKQRRHCLLVEMASLRAATEYTPEWLDAPALIVSIRAAEADAHAWSKHFSDARVEIVPGSHETLLWDESLETIARLIDAFADRVISSAEQH